MQIDKSMTVEEYAKRYGVPCSTVKGWIRDGTLETNRDVKPMLIKPGQKVPYKDPDIHRWRYQWK